MAESRNVVYRPSDGRGEEDDQDGDALNRGNWSKCVSEGEEASEDEPTETLGSNSTATKRRKKALKRK